MSDENLHASELAEARRQIVALNGVIARLGSDVRAHGPAEVAAANRRAEEADRRAEEALRLKDEVQAKLDAVLQSRSWRLTRILRVAGRLLRGDFAPILESLAARQRGR